MKRTKKINMFKKHIKYTTKRKYKKKKIQTGGNLDNYHFYVVNLEDRKDYFDKLKPTFDKRKLTLNKFKAIDTRTLDTRIFDIIPNIDRFLNNKDNEDGYNTRYKDEIITDRRKLGSLGCCFSHIKLYNQIVKDNIPNMVIIEDDAVLDPDFFDKFGKLVSDLPEDWDMVFLGISCAYSHDERCKKNDGIIKVKDNLYNINYIYGTYGYLINNNAAKKILENIFPIWWHIDTMLSYLIVKQKIKAYCTIPNLIFHPGNFSIDSVKYNMDTPYTSYKTTLNTG